MTWQDKDEYDEFEEEMRESPDVLLRKKIGDIQGCPVYSEDFAAWDLRHSKCKLKFEPIFSVNPAKSRVPAYLGMVITCPKCKEQFTKRC